MDVEANEKTGNEDEVTYRAVSFGRAADLLQRISIPVVVMPGRRMFRVLVHGHGFEVPVQDSRPLLGFHSTCFVSATTHGQAEKKALERVQGHWVWFSQTARGQLTMEVTGCVPVRGRFRRRSHLGFTFYAVKADVQPD